MIGILAFGSLIANPGSELVKIIVDRHSCNTPFPVEYARRTKSRANAPTIVRVPEGMGSSVHGVILVLRQDVKHQNAKNLLYRRELHDDTDETLHYNDIMQRAKGDALVIETLSTVEGFDEVYYTSLTANFTEILDTNRPQAQKAILLAQAAFDSLVNETFNAGKDGIKYLHDNIEAGIITPLTEPYRQSLLQMAANAPDLPTARLYFARQKGIIS